MPSDISLHIILDRVDKSWLWQAIVNFYHKKLIIESLIIPDQLEILKVNYFHPNYFHPNNSRLFQKTMIRMIIPNEDDNSKGQYYQQYI